MKVCEILAEEAITPKARMPRQVTPEAVEQARQRGFDTDTIWYHGTGKRFSAFRPAKESSELGAGIYLTTERRMANTWARQGGFILLCFIRQGELFDLQTITDPNTIRILHPKHTAAMKAQWGEKDSGYTLEQFKDLMKGLCRSHDGIVDMLKLCGYVGAYDAKSQIPGQVIIFDPTNVMIVARQPGE